MCGIFGVIVKKGTAYDAGKLEAILVEAALLSESRGKDSSGLAVIRPEKKVVHVVKGDVRVKQLLKEARPHQLLQEAKSAYTNSEDLFAAFGHARLVTNGSQLKDFNNQPVLKDQSVLIHNGIIVNNEELWEEHPELRREYEIDSEIINALLLNGVSGGAELSAAVTGALTPLKGNYSIAAFLPKNDLFLLATNNGSLYYISDHQTFVIFCSEAHYLKVLDQHQKLERVFGHPVTISQLHANQVMAIQFTDFAIHSFEMGKQAANCLVPESSTDYAIAKTSIENSHNKMEAVIDPAQFINRSAEQHLFGLLEYNTERINQLKRCTKCVLPETFPFIHFDEAGVCNYCKGYKKKDYPENLDKLKELIEPYRRKDGLADCIVPFSGGRDSTYSLHIIKKELGLNPITLTYDWGMVTDLARRNIARACGQLGVENIIVSADIQWKRGNIRKNIAAWLKNPQLGMIPLFMAGDKYFFYYTDRLKKQTGIQLNIWGINDLENTDFKTGFAGLAPKFDKERIYSISMLNKLKLFGYVGKNFIKSPGYINGSMIDSLGSFAVRYLAPKKDYYHLFDYYKWDENEINDLLVSEYGWEKAIDTTTTWRIGDGTASFYNYIYYTVAGFSEFDTFRSNQIREGMITREEALKLVEEENFPRYETMRWYLEIIGLDFKEVIEKVNAIPKLYA